jgi:hypothetical protein
MKIFFSEKEEELKKVEISPTKIYSSLGFYKFKTLL